MLVPQSVVFVVAIAKDNDTKSCLHSIVKMFEESGVRSQESGVKSQESGVRRYKGFRLFYIFY